MCAGYASFVFALDLSLASFHSVAVGFAILYSQRCILVNINAAAVTFIRSMGSCIYRNLRKLSLFTLFCYVTNTALNRLGFGMLTRWNNYVLIAIVDLNSSSRDR